MTFKMNGLVGFLLAFCSWTLQTRCSSQSVSMCMRKQCLLQNNLWFSYTINIKSRWKLHACTTWEKRNWDSPSPLFLSHLSSATCTTPRLLCIRGNNGYSRNGALFCFLPRLFIWPGKFQRPMKELSVASCTRSFLACAHTQTRTNSHIQDCCSAWRVFGYQGNLSAKDVVHPHPPWILHAPPRL